MNSTNRQPEYITNKSDSKGRCLSEASSPTQKSARRPGVSDYQCSRSDITPGRLQDSKTNKSNSKDRRPARSDFFNEKSFRAWIPIPPSLSRALLSKSTYILQPRISITCPREDRGDGAAGQRKDAARQPKTGQRDGSWQAYRRRRRAARSQTDGRIDRRVYRTERRRRDASRTRARLDARRSVPERADAGAERCGGCGARLAAPSAANHSSTVSFSLPLYPDNLSPPIFCLAIRDLHLPPASPPSSSSSVLLQFPHLILSVVLLTTLHSYGNTCAHRDTLSDGASLLGYRMEHGFKEQSACPVSRSAVRFAACLIRLCLGSLSFHHVPLYLCERHEEPTIVWYSPILSFTFLYVSLFLSGSGLWFKFAKR